MDVLGIDLDNTLICYDRAWAPGLAALGVAVPPGLASKRALRDHLRALPEGEALWQRLQAHVYGPGIVHARLAEGAAEFLAACVAEAVPVYIVSHKTEFAAAAPEGPSLRDAARSWLEAQGIVGIGGWLPAERIFFEPTREAKIARVVALGCTHLIDDLEETFREPSFPSAVEALWYVPEALAESAGPWHRFASFGAIGGYFRARWDAASAAAESALAARAGSEVAARASIAGGRNSRVYRLDLRDGRRLAAKHYRHHDARVRLEAEFGAFALLRGAGIDAVPTPVAFDDERLLALYEWVDGATATFAPGADAVDQCAAFVVRLAGLRPGDTAWTRPAREAVSALREVVNAIEQRSHALHTVGVHSAETAALQQFLAEEFLPAFGDVARACEEALRCAGLSLDDELPTDARVLSPSDFGLHNAICRADGTLCFIDFEYFGWDDPAKLVADFLLHPGMPLDEQLRRRFLAGVSPAFGAARLAERLPVAYALFGLKWCMILLNEFLPQHRARRRFAGGARDDAAIYAGQLSQARAMLQQVVAHHREFPYL